MRADGSGRGIGPVEITVLLLILVGFTVAAIVLLRVPLVFGHDEAVYAIWTRSWIDGGPATTIAPHRAPLISILGVPAYLAGGGSETAFRLVGLAFGLGAVVGVWALGRRIAGPVAGLIAAALVASAPPLIDAAALFETDLPAITLLVWALLGIHTDLEGRVSRGERPGPGLFTAAVLTAGAFYLRFGSALPIALIGVTALVLWWPAVREHADRVAAAVGLFAVLLVPHMFNAIVEFGTPWGRVVHTSRVSAAETPGAGLVGYIETLPAELAGWPVTIAAAIGLLGVGVHAVRAVSTGRLGARGRGLLLLAVPGIAHGLAMGMLAPPTTRFLFPALLLLITAGAIAAADVIGLLVERTTPAIAPGAVAVAVVVLSGLAAGAVEELREQRVGTGQWRDVLVEVSEVLLEEAGDDCGVLNAYVPHITWYGWCETYEFHDADLVDHDDRFLLLIERGKRQPEGEELDAFLSCVEEEPFAVFPRGEETTGAGDLYRFLDEPPATCPAPPG